MVCTVHSRMQKKKKQELAKDSNGILKRTLKSKNVMSEFLQNNLVRIEAD